MPWKIETSPDQQREDFVREALRQEKPFKELCHQHRISRKTATSGSKDLVKEDGIG